jgi:YegS/Rv2252/BmrU family lipid kinase
VTERVACIAHAASADWKRLPEALAVLHRRFGRVPVYPVGSPGEAETTVRELAQEVDVLVVYGGDGTVHQVANGLPVVPAEAPVIAVLPGGTGNDLVRGLGLPVDPVEAARAIVDGEPRAIDLLDTGTHRAVNGLNAGFAAAATDILSRRAKLVLGRAAYTVGGLIAAVQLPRWPVRIEVGDDVHEGEALAVVVGIGPSFGGGRILLPGADLADGLLDATVVPASTAKGELLAALARNRLPEGLPRLRGPSARLVTDMPCRLDGEAVPTPGQVRVLPGAWRLLLPRRV